MAWPTKTESQLLGIRGERAFLAAMPRAWGTIKHDSDFGIDLMLEIWTEGRVSKLIGRDVAVQIKSHNRFPGPQSDGSSLRPDYKAIRAELFYERLKRSTLQYLAKSNAFIASVYLDEPYAGFLFPEFRRIIPKQLSIRGIVRRNSEQTIAVTPIRPIADDLLATGGRSIEIRVPIHPLNFCLFVDSRKPILDDSLLGRRHISDYANGPTTSGNVVMFDNWTEVIADSLTGADFDTIFQIRYAPFVRKDPVALLREQVSLALSDVTFAPLSLWKLFECIVAGFYFKIGDMRWLEEILCLKSEFFSLLVMRLVRFQRAQLTPKMFATYLMAHAVWPRPRKSISPFAADPFNCMYGKTSVREFYDEGCGYLLDLIETNGALARETIEHMLTQPTRLGVNELCGQMVASASATNLTRLVTDVVQKRFCSTWERTKKPALDAIRALDSIGILCLDFSPSEK